VLEACTSVEVDRNDGCAPHKGLGFGQPVRGLKQRGQVVEADGDFRVFGSEALLVDVEGSAHEGLGLD